MGGWKGPGQLRGREGLELRRPVAERGGGLGAPRSPARESRAVTPGAAMTVSGPAWDSIRPGGERREVRSRLALLVPCPPPSAEPVPCRALVIDRLGRHLPRPTSSLGGSPVPTPKPPGCLAWAWEEVLRALDRSRCPDLDWDDCPAHVGSGQMLGDRPRPPHSWETALGQLILCPHSVGRWALGGVRGFSFSWRWVLPRLVNQWLCPAHPVDSHSCEHCSPHLAAK